MDDQLVAILDPDTVFIYIYIYVIIDDLFMMYLFGMVIVNYLSHFLFRLYQPMKNLFLGINLVEITTR